LPLWCGTEVKLGMSASKAASRGRAATSLRQASKAASRGRAATSLRQAPEAASRGTVAHAEFGGLSRAGGPLIPPGGRMLRPLETESGSEEDRRAYLFTALAPRLQR
jgi:hypothetical protein